MAPSAAQDTVRPLACVAAGNGAAPRAAVVAGGIRQNAADREGLRIERDTIASAILLNSFRRNPAVQALIFMPGATDEFYFFRRARARLTNNAPTLLDAVTALTNQTYIRATLEPAVPAPAHGRRPAGTDGGRGRPAHGGPDPRKAFRETRRLQRSRLGLCRADPGLRSEHAHLARPALARFPSFFPAQFRGVRFERLGRPARRGAGGQNQVHSQEEADRF